MGSAASPEERAGQDAEPVVRPSARVVLLDGRDRLLLFRWTDPRLSFPWLWTTPGGGVRPGEAWEAAALRELREETGLHGVPLGPLVWQRRVIFPFDGRPVLSDERYYLVRVPEHEVDISGMEQEEASVHSGHRWWSVEELAAARDEVFAPRRIASLLAPLIAGEIPPAPLEVRE